MRKIIPLLLYALLLLGCQPEEKKDEKIHIVTTTGMIADMVRNLVDTTKVNVIALMGEGVDPHLYKATYNDLKELRKADLIIYNGLHLEGKMDEVFRKMHSQKKVFVLSDLVPKHMLIKVNENTFDPHIWFDIDIWKTICKNLSKKLQLEIPSIQEKIEKNAISYLKSLDDLEAFVLNKVNQLSDVQKVLITAHDAFSYFGKKYGFKIKSLQGISTLSEYGIRDVQELINYIISHDIKAIFAETSVSAKTVQSIVEGCGSKGHALLLVEGLYSDAMGKKDTKEGTYIGMYTSNVNKIVNALR